jgi:hypothetical protein
MFRIQIHPDKYKRINMLEEHAGFVIAAFCPRKYLILIQHRLQLPKIKANHASEM